MAHYRQLIVQGDTGWHLMNPTSLWEAIRLAWLLWRRPDRVAALVGVKQEFTLAHLTPRAAEESSAQRFAARLAESSDLPAQGNTFVFDRRALDAEAAGQRSDDAGAAHSENTGNDNTDARE